MNRGIYPALSGGLSYEKQLSIISNNVANINTSGYKADRPVFKVDVPDRIPKPAVQEFDPSLPPFAQEGAGGLSGNNYFTDIDGVFTDFSPGVIRQTGNPLDVAIEGGGFFVISTPDGTRYTRSGSFTLDSSNVLTTTGGYMVMGENGPVILEEGMIEIDSEGQVSVNGSEVNRLRIVDFDSADNLRKDHGNMFTGSGEQDAGEYNILQGAVEMSNVNPVAEMASMIEVLRGYESYKKVMTTMDETSARANEVGSV